MYTELLKELWTALYTPHNNLRDVVEKYFHPDYAQCINGVILNREQYLAHIINQKKQMTVSDFNYKHILEKNNELFACYEVIGKNNHTLPLIGEVIAYFRFIDKQLIEIHGQVRLIVGDYADVDME